MVSVIVSFLVVLLFYYKGEVILLMKCIFYLKMKVVGLMIYL